MHADRGAPGVLAAASLSQLPIFINYGDGGPVVAKFVCGFLACDAHPFNPLLENLPPVIRVGNTPGAETS
jgi:hypothetical protein